MGKEKYRAGAYIIADWESPDYEDLILEQLKEMDKVIDDYEDIAITNVYTDKDTTRPLISRPGFMSLMLQIEEGRINCVVVDDIKRLTSNMVEFCHVMQKVFSKYDVEIIFHRGVLVSAGYARDIDNYIDGLRMANEEWEEDYDAGGYQ